MCTVEVDVKVTEYLQAGVSLIWVFYPDTRTISVYRANGQAARLGVGETLSGAEVLPGFACLVADVFPRHLQHGLDMPCRRGENEASRVG
jgi:hypothetical protein